MNVCHPTMLRQQIERLAYPHLILRQGQGDLQASCCADRETEAQSSHKGEVPELQASTFLLSASVQSDLQVPGSFRGCTGCPVGPTRTPWSVLLFPCCKQYRSGHVWAHESCLRHCGVGVWEQELLWDKVAVFFILPTKAGGSQSWTEVLLWGEGWAGGMGLRGRLSRGMGFGAGALQGM